MELRFMGRTYFASSTKVQTVASEQTACFKGQRYNLRVPVQTSPQRSNTSIRKYRGVAYTV